MKILEVHLNGGGVQSEDIYRQGASGFFPTTPHVSLFADPGDESSTTYDSIARMERDHGHHIPIRVVSNGHLSEDWFSGQPSKRGEPAMGASMPLHIQNPDPDAKKGQTLRTCSQRYKISALQKETRKLLKDTGAERARLWFGFSLDEAARMKPSHVRNFEHYFPLIYDRPIRRIEILSWFDKQGLQRPTRSACVMCPLRSNSAWRELRDTDPEGFERACVHDERLRAQQKFVSSFGSEKSHLRGVPFAHPSLVPLREANIEDVSRDQLDLFSGGCDSGYCGT